MALFPGERYKQLMVPEWENWSSKGINILIQCDKKILKLTGKTF